MATHGVTKKYRLSAVSYVGNAVRAISVRVGTLRKTEKEKAPAFIEKNKTKQGPISLQTLSWRTLPSHTACVCQQPCEGDVDRGAKRIEPRERAKQGSEQAPGVGAGEVRMDGLIPVLKSHPGSSVLVFSLLFRVVHCLLQMLPVPKAVKQNDLSWKWKNLSVSMVHSLLTGTWALTW